MMGISGAFSSLGINEQRSSPQNPAAGTAKVPKNYSTMSLPNLVSTERHALSPSFLPGSYCDDEADSNDQPIDFSKKYNETKAMKHGGRSCTFNKVVKSYNSSFTMYAETDLDQPTDYSLRYAEDDSESEECSKIPKAEATEFVQDTIKTYCTEDTPYETPFNFSTATSMSDLRIDDKAPSPKSDTGPGKEAVSPEKIAKCFSSGAMSPEKPVNYCEEGTPGYFSRVDSCGSLNSFPANDPPKQSLKSEESAGEKGCDKEARRIGKFPAEVKAVKFEEVVNYAEETPLMFSRSSSLASLDSIEQHSIHDDRSSVVSDFSRLTSGLISPSELPDSPSQTVPPSPKPRKNPLVFPPVAKKPDEKPPQSSKNVPKSSVFEDVVRKFKTESTPLQFSSATSLSSLIDDHDEVDPKKHNETVDQTNESAEETHNDLSESSEDEDILAACINIGMQNNRYSQGPGEVPSFKFSETPRTSPQALGSAEASPSERKQDMTSDSLRTYCTEDTPAILSQAGSNSELNLLSLQVENKIGDVVEDTDRVVAKMNNLNIGDLRETTSSLEEQGEEFELKESNRSHRSSFSSISDESEEALLQQCILAGMPKSNTAVTKSLPNKVDLENSHDTVVDFTNNLVGNESSDDEDILADCINIGMKNNRYSQSSQSNLNSPYKFSAVKDKSEVVNDSIKSYYTEDTPAVLSHAGSGTDLSVLSLQATENGGEKDFLSDSNFSDDDDDERLLAECVRYGMSKTTGTAVINDVSVPSFKTGISNQHKVDLNISLENNISDDSHSVSSDSSCESSQALLQECILAGMPRRKLAVDSTELTATEKTLLQQCIFEGMQKCSVRAPGTPRDEIGPSAELTESERLLLQQCILAGMPRRKPAADSSELSRGEKTLLQQCIAEGMSRCRGSPAEARMPDSRSPELTEAERALLQQCILAGMPKSRQQWMRRKEAEKPEHGCCVHCPRNNLNLNRAVARQSLKTRRRKGQGGEKRDANILNVTNQILALKKEIADRSHEEWV